MTLLDTYCGGLLARLILCPFLTGTGLPPTVELPLTGGGGSGPSSVSGGASTGNEGVCRIAMYGM